MFKQVFGSLRAHLEEMEKIISNMEKKVTLLSESSLLQKELEQRLEEISDLHHVIDEQECEIRWLKKKLKEEKIIYS